MVAVLIKINKQFGINRTNLLYWKFNEGSVTLHFPGERVTLAGRDMDTFRNWVEGTASDAPITYQYTIFTGAGGDE